MCASIMLLWCHADDPVMLVWAVRGSGNGIVVERFCRPPGLSLAITSVSCIPVVPGAGLCKCAAHCAQAELARLTEYFGALPRR